MNKQLVEALLYLQGQSGLASFQLKQILKIPISQARKLLQDFAQEFNQAQHGIEVVEFNDIFKFATRAEFKEIIGQFVTIEKRQSLSNAAIETAGIIAYKQPITKSQINQTRGVASEAVVNTLLVKGIIEEKGIAQTPGRPILYGVSDKFYDYFQLKSLKELPAINEIDESEGVEDEMDLFATRTNN